MKSLDFSDTDFRVDDSDRTIRTFRAVVWTAIAEYARRGDGEGTRSLNTGSV